MPKFVVTVAHYEDGDLEGCVPFVKVYSTVSRCVQEIEKHAEEAWTALVDPNDGDSHPWPGVETIEDGVTYEFGYNPYDRGNRENYYEYTITGVTVED